VVLAARLEGVAPNSGTFGWIGDLATLEAKAGAWTALEARADDSRLGFQNFDWVRGWAARWAEPGELRILLAETAAGDAALAWPMTLRQKLGATVLQGLGEPMSQYHGALIDPAHDAAALYAAALRHIAASGADLLSLARVRGDSPLVDALIGAGAAVVRRATAPFVDLGGGGFARAQRGGKSAATRRRRLRQLEAKGPVAFGFPIGQRQAREWIGAALRFKRAWAYGAGRIARAPFDARFEPSFLDALEAGTGATLRIFGMLVGDRLVGVEISLAYRGRLFGHVLAPDPEWRAYGLGAILAEASIARAKVEGYETFDLLAPADPYKLAFADGDVEVLDLALPLTRRGAFVAPLDDALDRTLRLAARRAPAVLARAWMRRADRRRESAAP
jgi:CelD/BcsL family acetyltransferase involved in cellulose biosynthesis